MQGIEMKLKGITGIVLTLFLIGILTLAFNIQPVKAEPRIWTVDDDGPADFHTIQEAINAANPGDTIFVSSGTYYEHVVINKTVSLVGENLTKTIINGGETGYTNVVNITVSNVKISKFTIRASGHGGTGIYLTGSSNTTITENNITNNWFGIWLHYSSNNIISNNHVINNDVGIGVYSSSSNNIIYENNIHGIYSTGVSPYASSGISVYQSLNNTIFGNEIIKNGHGIYLESSSNNVIVRNNVSGNGFGIRPYYYSSKNTIIENNLSRNEIGIWIYIYSSDNTMYRNQINDNNIGVDLQYSSNNKFYHNNFINNTQQVYSYKSINTWDDGYPSGGNHWSDYNGIDLYSGPYQNVTGSDGIGDIPYIIDENNTDNYPLMSPWSPPSVGGFIVPINKLELLMPYYIGVASIILITATAVVIKKRER